MAPRLPRFSRFALILVLGLALLTAAAAAAVQRTTRAWFENDLALRADLALSGVRRTIAERWDQAKSGLDDRGAVEGEQGPLGSVLREMTYDERLMAAALCSPDRGLIAATARYPKQLGCAALEDRMAKADVLPAEWRGVLTLPAGRVHVSALPVRDGERDLGFAVLVHDMSFVAAREKEARKFLILAFAVLAVAASVLTQLAARMSWRSFTAELWRMVRGVEPAPDFRPLPRDMRDLVERLHSEREHNGRGGPWSAERLRDLLGQRLGEERVIIVANREPYIHHKEPDGTVRVLHPASGLVTALEPVMRACSGVWVAHGSGSADRETVDRHARVRVPPGEESYALRRVWLTPEEERGYYYGFANEGLWPICHIAHHRPTFRSEDWRTYQEVNRRFAAAAVEEADSDEPIILVQDYHFALVPRFIRQQLPRAVILTFWHVPWPNAERFGICPFRQQILDGLLGSSIVGFHTQQHCNNFLDSVDRYLEARIDRDQHAVVQRGRASLVRPYPISVEWPSRWAASSPTPAECRRSVLSELDLPLDALIGVGVDRLDYTKGIEERLLTVERMLERFPQYRGRFVFVQLAAPSRTSIEAYRQLDERVQATANRINERFGSGKYRPIIFHRAHHEPPTVYRFYRAADLCYVSSLHDGMNLVAKEFVVAREDERGVLVLSQFTGAARELGEALVVNPYDIEEASAALSAALEMRPEEQSARMRAMRAFLAQFNVYRWAGRMLVDADELRRRERFAGSWPSHLPEPAQGA
jgi:trehalose 6-phosphate synthase